MAADGDKPKRGRRPLGEDGRVFYPGLQVEGDGNVAKNKITAVPADYDPKKHIPLRKADFAEEYQFLEYQADEYEKRAKKLREEAAEIKQLGSKEDRDNMRRLKAMQEKMQDTLAALAASGVDTSKVIPADLAKVLLGNAAKADAATAPSAS
jgi:hypothetical protein